MPAKKRPLEVQVCGVLLDVQATLQCYENPTLKAGSFIITKDTCETPFSSLVRCKHFACIKKLFSVDYFGRSPGNDEDSRKNFRHRRSLTNLNWSSSLN